MEENNWISVDDRLPDGYETDYGESICSVSVEVLFDDGTTSKDDCYAIINESGIEKIGTWSTPGHRWIDGYGAKVVAWRYIKEQTNDAV